MSDKSIIKLIENPEGFGYVADELDAALFDSTSSIQHNHTNFADEALGLYIGVCDSTDMIENATAYPRDEFMFIIEGSVEIKNNKTGKVETIKSGESAVIPNKYDCKWHQQGYLRRFYVIYEPQKKPDNPVTKNVVYISENSELPWQETSDGYRKKVLYKNNDQRFTAGVWQSKALTTGLIDFPYHEFIFINQGSLTCTDERGGEHHFKTGDALFIPQGTRCAWQVENKVSIHFTQIK